MELWVCVEKGCGVVGMCREMVWSYGNAQREGMELWVCVERGYGVKGMCRERVWS